MQTTGVFYLPLDHAVDLIRATLRSTITPATMADVIEIRPILTDHLDEIFYGTIPEDMKQESAYSILMGYGLPTDIIFDINRKINQGLIEMIERGTGMLEHWSCYEYQIQNGDTLYLEKRANSLTPDQSRLRQQLLETNLQHGDDFSKLSERMEIFGCK